MTEQELVTAICDRAAAAGTRTDYANIRRREIAPPATPEQIRDAEQQLGFSLYPLHRHLLQRVGNGGFGPGDGFIGTAGGSLDVEGRSFIELGQTLFPNRHLPVVALCDWGDGIWACMDAATGAILTSSEFGLMDTGQHLHDWLEQWAAGVNLWRQTVVLGETSVRDPRTKELMTVPTVLGMQGKPYVQSRQ